MSTHTWRFFRAGGVDQVRLDTSEDLRNLASLDQKLWVALACPVKGLEIDERLLALIDADGDLRVRAPDVLAAVDFVCQRVREPAEILRVPTALPLASLRDDTAEGRGTAAAAKVLLAALGKGANGEITLAEATDENAIFAKMPLNGDGIVTEASTDDPALAAAIAEIVACVGGERDRNGKDGVSVAKVEAFFKACEAFVAWSARGPAESAVLLPLGTATADAHSALSAVAAKIDDFFARVRLAGFDARSLAALNGPEAELTALATKTLSAASTELEPLPLAQVSPGRPLPLAEGVNPAWATRVATLRTRVVAPLLGDRAELSSAEWEALKATLAPYAAWQAARAGGEVAGLGLDRVSALLAGETRASLLALIAKDEAHRPEATAIAEVSRLVRYYCLLGQLLRNFVNFADFYGRKDKAVFQVGRVFFDQRSCDLVVRVLDPGRHASMASLAGAYLVYLDCVRRADGRHLTVCAAVTDGDADNLMVGRNGLFYDRQGRDYDATITKIVDNPISLRQAFWSPYKKFLRSIEEFVAKRAAAAEAESNTTLTGAAEKVAQVDKTVPPPAPAKLDTGTVAALGVAVGGITAALGAILDAMFGLGMWMPLGILGIMLLISSPSVFIAALKLRKRNIGPILDADGWAVNTQARVNIPFGRSLTALAALPAGAARDLGDPFAAKPVRWPYYLGALLLVIGLAAGLAWKGIVHIPGFPAAPPPEAAPAPQAAVPEAPAAPAP